MRISLAISNLTCGGAQRVLVLLANEWSQRGHDVEILTLADLPVFFSPRTEVAVLALGVERPSRSPMEAWARLRRTLAALRQHWTLNRPDVIVSFTTRVNVQALIAAKPLGIPVVVSERTDPQFGRESFLWKALRRRCFRDARGVVVQSPEASNYFASWGLGPKLVIIGNPVPFRLEALRADRHGSLIVAVGRLHFKKGQDLLLAAFSKLRNPNARLRLVGDGPLRNDLERLSVELGIEDRCEFVGESLIPWSHLRDADVFALPSRVEGFPNALAEAMSAGLATVSFDCPSGPRQLVRNGETGLLVPPEDVSEFSDALERLLGDLELRDRLGVAAQRSMRDWSIDTVVDRWDSVLQRAVQQ